MLHNDQLSNKLSMQNEEISVILQLQFNVWNIQPLSITDAFAIKMIANISVQLHILLIIMT